MPLKCVLVHLTSFAFLFVVSCGGGGGGTPVSNTPLPQPQPPPQPPIPPPSGNTELTTVATPCVNGQAGSFTCNGISLQSRIPNSDMGGTRPNDETDSATGADLWGWHDTETDREYALMGMSNGTAFVEVTDPVEPVYLGRLPTQADESLWRDIKVYQNHAYIVADHAGSHGMQVFDLTRLRDIRSPRSFSADLIYGDFERSHNLAINEESGFIYALLTDTCGGGFHMINLEIPTNPQFAGCRDNVHTHDAQCVIYQGVDSDHVGKEICFSADSSYFSIVDVSDKSSPGLLGWDTYDQLAYVHQGWLTEDHRYFLLGDELDESEFNLPTITHVYDVSDLSSPEHLYAYEHETEATDHNLYVLGNRVYQANYQAGLRILEFNDLSEQDDMKEIAFFDTYPEGDSVEFAGAWSVYPYLPSGTIIVSDKQNGLFVLSLDET